MHAGKCTRSKVLAVSSGLCGGDTTTSSHETLKLRNHTLVVSKLPIDQTLVTAKDEREERGVEGGGWMEKSPFPFPFVCSTKIVY